VRPLRSLTLALRSVLLTFSKDASLVRYKSLLWAPVHKDTYYISLSSGTKDNNIGHSQVEKAVHES
jgi:hypothetical protein